MPTNERARGLENQANILPPLTSTNRRLLEAYRGSEDLLNAEYTLPVPTTEIFVDPRVKADPVAMQMIQDHLRVIITPYTAARLAPEQVKQVRVLSSALENGRVLEADEKIVIDGTSCTLTMKGVCATRFLRDRKFVDLLPWGVKDLSSKQQEQLRRMPFFSTVGTLDEYNAVEQTVRSGKWRNETDIDAEQVVGIFEIDVLPDQNGVLHPIEYFRERGELSPNVDPVILYRAVKSNFRLLEPYTLLQLGREQTIAHFFDTALQEFAFYNGSDSSTMGDYFLSVAGKIVHQELPLILDGHYIADKKVWMTLARNVSRLAEELDLEDIRKLSIGEHGDLTSYMHHVKNNFRGIEYTLRIYASLIQQYSNGSIDYALFGKRMLQETLAALSLAKAEELFDFYSSRDPMFRFKNSPEKIYAQMQDELIAVIGIPSLNPSLAVSPYEDEELYRETVLRSLPEGHNLRGWIGVDDYEGFQ